VFRICTVEQLPTSPPRDLSYKLIDGDHTLLVLFLFLFISVNFHEMNDPLNRRSE
jgi:hypothetical protein